MTAVTTYFTDFLKQVRLTPELREACETKHRELRERLAADPDVSPIYVDAFLQGSYRRHTGVRILAKDEHVDVDLVVVTTFDHETITPDKVVDRFRPFLDRHYAGQWEVNDRSMKISFADTPVTLDLVVTAAPSEEVREAITKAAAAEWRIEASTDENGGSVALREALEGLRKMAGEPQWQQEYLWIPDRNLETWERTHPLEQIRWTEAKNASTNGHFINVVKSAKWWRKRNAVPEYPKGYPLEHLLGQNCPDAIGSVAEGLTRSLEAIRDNYRYAVDTGTVPSLPDYGVPEHDVLKRVTPVEFAAFWRLIDRAAGEARPAFDAVTVADSVDRWQRLLGREFPDPPKDGGFTQRVDKTNVATTGRYGNGRLG